MNHKRCGFSENKTEKLIIFVNSSFVKIKNYELTLIYFYGDCPFRNKYEAFSRLSH
jgi:hypothetical protein